MAAWDALARAAGCPLCELLGGTTGPVPAYNSNGLWLRGPDAIAAEAQGLYDRAEALDLAAALEPAPLRSRDDMTLFKSTGTGLQDLALSVAVLEAATADGAGTVVDDLLALKRFGPGGRT